MTLRGLWTGLVMLLTTAACSLAAAVWTTFRPGSDGTMIVGRIWSRLNLRAAGARVSWERLDLACANRPCIYVSNHQSNVDIWALIAVLPAHTRFVAKHSLFKLPLLGWALRVSDFISIDRGNRAKAIRSLDEAAAKIRRGRSVVLFAEGTRSAGDRLAPFKKGPFHLALAAGVPIVPVAISGSGKVMPPRGLKVRSGDVRVRFGEPIDVTPYRPLDVQGLLDVVHRAVSDALSETIPENGARPASNARADVP